MMNDHSILKSNQIDIEEKRLFQYHPEILTLLLKDNTTKHNIRWATDDYEQYGSLYKAECEITPILILHHRKDIIQPRIFKMQTEQDKRTKEKAEVFTPSWICNAQNNLIDEAWFGRKAIFNTEQETTWITSINKIEFPNVRGKTWQDYVDLKRMEITCGEAPYLVSRYDTVTGDKIPIQNRIGLLDRKLRIIGENTKEESEWFQWTVRAYESIYGYDLQGDNVLLSRENLLYTLIDYMMDKFNHFPEDKQLKRIATILSWNIFQMNGITMTAPFSKAETKYQQISMLNLFSEESQPEEMPCMIKDWRSKKTVLFKDLGKESSCQ